MYIHVHTCMYMCVHVCTYMYMYVLCFLNKNTICRNKIFSCGGGIVYFIVKYLVSSIAHTLTLTLTHSHSHTHTHTLTLTHTHTLTPYRCLEAGVEVDKEGMSFSVDSHKDPLLRHEAVHLVSRDDVSFLQHLQRRTEHVKGGRGRREDGAREGREREEE